MKRPKLAFFSKIFVLITVIVASYKPIIAQSKFITFHSNDEKNLFENLHVNEDYLRLILLTELTKEGADAYILDLNQFIQGINWIDEDKMKPNKKLKQIFKQVHQKFLRKYEEKASVKDMFSNGNYQCVSASILYAYIFEKLNIPYEIKEQPTHVYVIAFPENANILIETTDPTLGVYVPNTKVQNQYVQNLIKTKYLDQDYVNKVGVEKAFNEFLYGKINVSFQELIGLAFYNLGVYDAEDQNYESAYANFYKANKLYPAQKHEFLQYSILAELVNRSKIEKLEDWDALIVLANLQNREDAKLVLKSRFYNQISNDLLRGQNRNNVSEVYNKITNELKDTILLNELRDHYMIESSRSYILSKDFKSAIPILEDCLKNNPNSPIAQGFLSDCIFQEYTFETPTAAIVEKMVAYGETYPFLKKDMSYQHFITYFYGLETIQNFEKEKYKEGIKYYHLMLNALQNNPKVRERVKEIAFGAFKFTTIYYSVVKKDKKNSLATIEQGKLIYPDLLDKNDLNMLVKHINKM
ncbi:hypothetical protein [Sphingobacterium sp. UDSM-2020]|uniref:hypothetical protein n=1 Tax=Sphingobacterium sp. UDSM-2020 TaxID=2795738 RepID=UPI00193895BD|nr:hypothetical protein [Sphingobacterium sp. UDSM-2020]QQD12652.1 hypothetical protein JAZ75_18905 [Sphingobacterium sp. UDSM-2020]